MKRIFLWIIIVILFTQVLTLKKVIKQERVIKQLVSDMVYLLDL